MTNGTKVKTNQKYFEDYGRVVYGTIENNITFNDHVVTVVRVGHQVGNVIVEHQGQLLAMMAGDLEEVVELSKEGLEKLSVQELIDLQREIYDTGTEAYKELVLGVALNKFFRSVLGK